ncbi:DegQ family serine endoprotease [Jiella sp. M17.18]|uniref:DegQ family serine endoprotease n=1 Tax=Jiella sp. M17.18 TaxID=3234247 RepID=UPI0034DF68A6
MRQFSILKKHRIAAGLGAAAIAVPLATLPVLGSTTVFALGGASQAQAQTQSASNDKTPVDAKVTSDMSTGSLAPIVSADKPAVVTIISHMSGSENSPTAERGHGHMGQMDPRQMPFDQFFRHFFEQQMPDGQGGPNPFQAQPDHQMEALGSGFIIDANGTIVTNNHVVQGGKDIKVILDDGTQLPAKVLGTDPKSDLAVLKVDAGHDLPTISWGDSDQLKLGDKILAIGNPFGIGTTVTSGIVSARGRDLNGGPYDNFIQVDAAINKGNSGGPLVAMNGQVVGIDTAIYSPNGGNVGVGFAIPSDEAKAIVQKLITHGSIQHGFIGVEIQPVTQDVKDALGLKTKSGALVAKVTSDSPASRAGIKTGDIITEIGGKPVDDARALARDVADLTPDTQTSVTVLRHGDQKQLSITIGNMKTLEASNGGGNGDQFQGGAETSALGMQLGRLTDQTRQELNLPSDESGVLVEDVNQNSAAADDGLSAGDVILSVNQHPVKTPRDVENAVKEAKNSGRKQVLLLVAHNDQRSFVALPVSGNNNNGNSNG